MPKVMQAVTGVSVAVPSCQQPVIPRPTSVNCSGNSVNAAISVTNSIVIQSQIGTLQNMKRPNSLPQTHWLKKSDQSSTFVGKMWVVVDVER